MTASVKECSSASGDRLLESRVHRSESVFIQTPGRRHLGTSPTGTENKTENGTGTGTGTGMGRENKAIGNHHAQQRRRRSSVCRENTAEFILLQSNRSVPSLHTVHDRICEIEVMSAKHSYMYVLVSWCIAVMMRGWGCVSVCYSCTEVRHSLPFSPFLSLSRSSSLSFSR